MMTYTDLVVITEVPEPYGQVVLSGPAATRTYEHVPAGALHDLPWCLAQAAVTCQGAPTITVVVPSTNQLAEQIEGGWRVTGVELDSGWYTVTRPGDSSQRAINLCVLERLNPARTPLFRPGWPAQEIAARLRRYLDLVGQPWYATAGVTSCALMRQVPLRQPPAWWGDDIPEGIPGSVDLDWSPAAGGRAPKVGHRWDVRAQYLAAAQAAVLGSDRPASEGPIPWDARRPGWWLVPVADLVWWPPELDGSVPQPWSGEEVQHYETGTWSRWVTTPVLEFVRRHRPTDRPMIRILDAYVSQRGGRHLRRWAETLRDARYTAVGEQDPVEVLDAVKATYTEGIGMLGRRGGRVYRPDWRATVIDLAKVLLLDKLVQARKETGIWPSRINRDSVWYDLPPMDPPDSDVLQQLLAAWPADDPKIGRLRYEGYEGPEPEPTQGGCGQPMRPVSHGDTTTWVHEGPPAQEPADRLIPDGFTTSLGLGPLPGCPPACREQHTYTGQCEAGYGDGGQSLLHDFDPTPEDIDLATTPYEGTE